MSLVEIDCGTLFYRHSGSSGFLQQMQILAHMTIFEKLLSLYQLSVKQYLIQRPGYINSYFFILGSSRQKLEKKRNKRHRESQ